MKNKLTLVFLLGFLYIACGNIYAQTPPPPGDQPPGGITPDIYDTIPNPGDQPPGWITDSISAFNGSTFLPTVPPSPQAEAFQKYGESSINYSTGVPDISIPLYEINHRGYKLPIILKYYPQPLKPGYNYDVFGQGWGLSVNSCISRSIEYNPDEWNGFKIENSIFSEDLRYNDPSVLTEYNYAHDKFHAVLPDGSDFDFVIDATGKPLVYVISGSRPVKMSCQYNTFNIQSFTVIDENGVKYTFAEGDTPFWAIATNKLRSSNVSWQLTRIDLPNSLDPITFSYGLSIEPLYNNSIKDELVKISLSQVHPYLVQIAQCDLMPTYQSVNYKMKLLTSISCSSADIVLDYQNQGNAEHNYVKKIRIYEAGALREVDLAMTESTLYAAVAKSNVPLVKLDSITIKSSLPSDDSLVYRCTYSGLGGGYYAGIDHWGFLNNEDVQYQVANFNLFVPFDVNYYGLNGRGITVINKSPLDVSPYNKVKLSNSSQNYDNRQPASPERHGVLSRLTYPTGGYTDFVFENHRFLTSTDSEGNYIYDSYRKRVMTAGGFRIKKIVNYSSDSKVTEVKNFRYGKTYAEARTDNINFDDPASRTPNFHTGIGEAVVDPNILTYMSYTSTFWKTSISPTITRNLVLGLNEYGQHISFVDPFRFNDYLKSYSWRWECEFSSTNFRNVLNGRSPVIYPEVTVYYGDIDENEIYTPEKTTGKTVYKYDINDVLINDDFKMDTTFFERIKYYGNTLTYDPKSYRYNILKEKTDYRTYNGIFNPVRKETNNWRYNYEQVYDYQYTNPYPLSYYSSPDYPFNASISNYFQGKSINYGTALLESHTTTSYNPYVDSIAVTESYLYKTNNQLSTKDVKNSNNQSVREEYIYPEINQNGSTPDIIQKMVDKNIIAPIVNQVKKVLSFSAPDKAISGYKIDYNEFTPAGTTTPVIMPEKLYELEDTTYALSTQILSYTIHGNPQEAVTRDNMHTVYLWGYGDRYLIAEIKNATLAQVNSAVQSEFGVSIEALATPDITQLKNLRNNANLRDTYVTTYTYGSWGKVTSITDPAGKTTYYDYDSFGRLTESYYYENDDTSKKRTIEKYEYHYKN